MLARMAMAGPELSQAQRTKYTKRRAQIWEALHPDDAKRQRDADLTDESNTQRVALLDDAINLVSAQAAPIQESEQKKHGGKRSKTKPENFATSTESATGQSKATTNRALARAEALGDDADHLPVATRTAMAGA